jgi:hypothetical protein
MFTARTCRIRPMMWRTALLLALVPLASRADESDLEQPPTSAKARQLREEGKALWDRVQAVWEKVRHKKEVSPAEAVEAVTALEKATELLEKSLREEWNGETNRALADAARAWCWLQPLLPPAEPTKKEADAQRQARVRDVRDFVMKWGRERRADSILRTCPKCEGRKEIRTPFGDKSTCGTCSKRGRLVDRDALIAARWSRHSPLHRAQSRNEQALNRLLRSLPPDEQKDPFAPYVSSVSIKEVEDNGLWARVKAVDIVQPLASSPKTEKTDVTYVLFRVGKLWYVYDKHADKELIDLSEKLEPSSPAK